MLNKLPKYKLSQKKNAEILRKIAEMDLNNSPKQNFLHYFLTQFKMKKLSALVIAILALGGVYYGVQGSFVQQDVSQVAAVEGSYQEHLANAQEALDQIQVVIKGENPGFLSYFMGSALASSEDVVVLSEEDSAEVVELTELVVEETDSAIVATSTIEDGEELQQALEEVSDAQDEQLEVLTEVSDTVENDEVVETVVAALDETVEVQEEVQQASDDVEEALINGEEAPSVEIRRAALEERRAELKEKMEQKANEALEMSKEILNDLQESGATEEEIARAQLRLDRITQAVEDGKYGRAFGQGRALEVRQKHLERKEERRIKKAEHGENFVERSSERLEELVESGASEEEIAEFQEHIAEVKAAIEDGDLEKLDDLKHEGRKNEEFKKLREEQKEMREENREEMKERREELKEKREEKED